MFLLTLKMPNCLITLLKRLEDFFTQIAKQKQNIVICDCVKTLSVFHFISTSKAAGAAEKKVWCMVHYQ